MLFLSRDGIPLSDWLISLKFENLLFFIGPNSFIVCETITTQNFLADFIDYLNCL